MVKSYDEILHILSLCGCNDVPVLKGSRQYLTNEQAPVISRPLPCMGVVSAFTVSRPELEHWLVGRNALCDYLAAHTIEEADGYAAGHPWSRVIWDVTALAWLLDKKGELLHDRLVPSPIPQYDHHYSFDPGRHLIRYVFHVNRDALMEDLFTRLTKQ